MTIVVDDFMGLLEVMLLGTALGYDRPTVGLFGSRLRFDRLFESQRDKFRSQAAFSGYFPDFARGPHSVITGTMPRWTTDFT